MPMSLSLGLGLTAGRGGGGAGAPPVNGLVAEGDSLTAGTGPVPIWTTQFASETGLPVINVAHSGDAMSLMDTEFATNVAPNYSATTANWLFLLAGVNDIFNGVSAATLIVTLQSMINKAKAAGFAVAIGTLLKTAHSNWDAGKEAQRVAFNNHILANYAAMGADRIADLAAVPELSDPNNTTYFMADKLHLQVPGFTAVATAIRLALSVPVGLAPLSISNTAPVATQAWSATISNRKVGSTIVAAASDGTALTVTGNTVSGTFATTGAKTITLTETLGGYAFSPRQTAIAATVSAPVATGQDSVWGSAGTLMVRSNGNRDVVGGSNVYRTARSSIGKAAGKWYYELKMIALTNADTPQIGIGFHSADMSLDQYQGQPSTTGKSACFWLGSDSNFLDEVTAGAAIGPITSALNDIWMMALDADAGKVWLGRNGTWFSGGDPAAGTTPWATFTPAGETWHFGVTLRVATDKMQLPATLTYAPPSGFAVAA